MLLDRDDWYDIAHDLEWSLSYVEHADVFPDVWSGSKNIPHEAWSWCLPGASCSSIASQFGLNWTQVCPRFSATGCSYNKFCSI
jgi:hypothetical protein